MQLVRGRLFSYCFKSGCEGRMEGKQQGNGEVFHLCLRSCHLGEAG